MDLALQSRQLREKLGPTPVSKMNLVDVVGEAMKQVELFSKLTGPQKRELVLSTIKDLIKENSSLSETEKGLLLITMEHFAPSMIDLIVHAADLGINLPVACCCCR